MRRLPKLSTQLASALLVSAWFISAVDADQPGVKLIIRDGQLAGAHGVEVDGALYSVHFVEGSCIQLFTGCDEASDFIFPSYKTSKAAADALLAQVLVDGPAGDFRSDPTLTVGCSHPEICGLIIPYERSNDTISAFTAINGAGDAGAASIQSKATALSTTSSNFQVYARFKLLSD